MVLGNRRVISATYLHDTATEQGKAGNGGKAEGVKQRSLSALGKGGA